MCAAARERHVSATRRIAAQPLPPLPGRRRRAARLRRDVAVVEAPEVHAQLVLRARGCHVSTLLGASAALRRAISSKLARIAASARCMGVHSGLSHGQA
jgi:hypothetical protein